MANINASDYNEKLQNPAVFFRDSALKGGKAARVPGKRQLFSFSGANAITYKFTDAAQRLVAVRCFTIDLKLPVYSDLAERYAAISQFVNAKRHPWFVAFEYQREGVFIAQEWVPLLKMEWVDGVPLTSYVRDHVTHFDHMLTLAENFRAGVRDLKRMGCAHGDLQHNNILVESDGKMRLVDYDGMFVPGLQGRRAIEIGEPNYQSPKRSGADYHERLDHFSAITIYLSLLALATAPRLLPMTDDLKVEPLLIRKDDLKHAKTSPLFQCLRDIGYTRAVDLLVEQCAIDNTRNVLDLEAFIKQSGLHPVKPFTRALTPACEAVMMPEARFNLIAAVAASTAPAPVSEPVTQPAEAPPVPTPAVAPVGEKPRARKPDVNRDVGAPIVTAPKRAPITWVETVPTPKVQSAAAPAPRTAGVLPFRASDRVLEHFVYALIAAGLFTVLTQPTLEVFRILGEALPLALAFAGVSFGVQFGRDSGRTRLRAVIYAVLIGGLAALGGQLAVDAVANAGVITLDAARLVMLIAVTAAWALPAAYFDRLSIRLIVTSAALGIVYVSTSGDASHALTFAAVLSLLPWTHEILYGEDSARTHWFNFADATDRFIARAIALFMVIAPWWATALYLGRTAASTGNINLFYAHPQWVLIAAEALIPALIFAVVISALIGWQIHFTRRRWMSAIGALVALTVISGLMALVWRSVMQAQTVYSISYGAYEGLLRIPLISGLATLDDWNLILPTALGLIFGVIGVVTAYFGSTRPGRVVKGAIAFGVIIGVIAFTGVIVYPALLDDLLGSASTPAQYASFTVVVTGIAALSSLLVSVPLWSADFLASDKP